jgi:hypothetical protein
MSGVHKQILAKLVSPQALLAMSQRVFNTYYDTGRFEIVHSERGYFARDVATVLAGITTWGWSWPARASRFSKSPALDAWSCASCRAVSTAIPTHPSKLAGSRRTW